MGNYYYFHLLSPLPFRSVLPGHDVTRDTLIKFSWGTRPHHSPHSLDWLLFQHTHHTHTQAQCILLWCGSPSSLFCGPSNYRAFLCEVYFRGCSALCMFSSYNGLVYMWPKSNTHADMDAGLRLAALLAFQSAETLFERRLVFGHNQGLYPHT